MLPQTEFESPMLASAQAPVAIAALTQDRALIGLLRSTVDATSDLILVTSEDELRPHLHSRRVSVALLDSMFVEGDLASLAERLRETWPDLVLVVVGTAEEQSKVASQITSGVVYRFLHRPVSAPRVRLFVEAALRRHEVEYVERTLEQTSPGFSKVEAAKPRTPGKSRVTLFGIIAAVAAVAIAGGWYFLSARGEKPADQPEATVVSEAAADRGAAESLPASTPAPQARIPEETPMVATPKPAPVAAPAEAAPAPEQSVADRLRDAPPAAHSMAPAVHVPPAQKSVAQSDTEQTTETAPQTPPPPPVLTHEQLLNQQLAEAEAALQRGELATPPDRNAVELFRGALALDPANTLAKAGLVRVADRLLSAAERALTAGNPEDARNMVDVAETLTPATARGAFLAMQIEMEHERAALTRAHDSDAEDQATRGATYLRLANARLRAGSLIEPSEDNARFYLEAARQIVPDDPALEETTRALRRELLTRAANAANTGNAADTERWLANADAAGAGRQEMTAVRRLLQDTLIGTRAGKITTLAQSFNAALAANSLLQPANGSAKSYLLALINADAGNPAVASARAQLGTAYLREMKSALTRGDLTAADAWLLEVHTIGFASRELDATETDLTAARAAAAQRNSVVGANSLARIEYVAPKIPNTISTRALKGWIELEFTVRTDGSTADIVVTNASPRKVFDSSAIYAISQWRYKPVLQNGKPVDQRAAVRIRFSEE
ncbi:MAG TPA: TonB family protein [Steroidobacteraceae bacterium]|nr:TonB family protein [Steroidobacteraceae bacterium]